MPEAEKPDSTTLSRRRFCTTASAIVAGAGAGSSVAAAASTPLAFPDENQALVAAGAEFYRLLQIERDQWNAIPDDSPYSSWAPAEAAHEKTSVVVDQIALLPALTMEGFLIKARAAA